MQLHRPRTGNPAPMYVRAVLGVALLNAACTTGKSTADPNTVEPSMTPDGGISAAADTSSASSLVQSHLTDSGAPSNAGKRDDSSPNDSVPGPGAAGLNGATTSSDAGVSDSGVRATSSASAPARDAASDAGMSAATDPAQLSRCEALVCDLAEQDCVGEMQCCSPLAPLGVSSSEGELYGPVAISGDLAFVGDHNGSQLHVFDISARATPLHLTSVALPTDVIDIVVVDTTVFVAHWSGMSVFDVADPSAPSTLLDVEADVPRGLGVSGSTLAFATGGGIYFYDITDAKHPNPVGSYGEYSSAIALTEDLAYITTPFELQVLDISKPDQVVRGAIYYRDGVPLRDVMVDGDELYLVNADGGVEILDITDRRQPVSIASIEDVGSSTVSYSSVNAVSEGRLFLGLGSTLLLYDVSDPKQPELLATYLGSNPGSDRSIGVAVSGKLAVVSAGDTGLVTLNVDFDCR